jgi:hypothetical protein
MTIKLYSGLDNSDNPELIQSFGDHHRKAAVTAIIDYREKMSRQHGRHIELDEVWLEQDGRSLLTSREVASMRNSPY